ncbi:MAG TPA: AI-2E family transporter [Bacteroidales bacterium]
MKNKLEIDKKVGHAINITLKVALLFGLLYLCFMIIQPFVAIGFWALIIAVSVYPLFEKLVNVLNGRKNWAAVIITLILMAIIVVPGEMFVQSVVKGVIKNAPDIESRDFTIPMPDEKVREWPIIGDLVFEKWRDLSNHTVETLSAYTPQLKAVGQWIINAIKDIGIAFFQFFIAIILAGILLATSDQGANFIRMLYSKVIGEKGIEFAKLTEITIRNVTNGVLGVALAQSLLAGTIFLLAGVPLAGLWALFCFVLAAAQIGPGPVIFGVIAYLFITQSTVFAIAWTIPLILVTFVDNILKPLLMGKGAQVPMMVIFLGSIGGFILSGILGLFLGAIILALGYKFLISWIQDEPLEEEM